MKIIISVVVNHAKRRVRYRRVRYHINGEGRVRYHPMYCFDAIGSTFYDLRKISSRLIWVSKFLWQVLHPKLTPKHTLYQVIYVRQLSGINLKVRRHQIKRRVRYRRVRYHINGEGRVRYRRVRYHINV